ncbi:MAG: hypothetical protein AAB437_03800 [Patescibacteria group bacterium]
MKHALINLIILSAVLSFNPTSVQAISPSMRRDIRNTIRETIDKEDKISITPGEFRKEIKKEIKEKIKNKGLMNKVKNFLKKNLKFEAKVNGKITVIGDNDFSLTGEDGTYQINITDKTQLLRKFGGKSKLGEYSVGDDVMVIGKFTDDTKKIIEAKVIRNLSIQKRFGAFFGKVTVRNADNFVMETAERGTQTVYFGSAKFVGRNEKSMTYSDIKMGDRVRVKGVWDKTLSKINEVTQVKDFSIPVIVPTQTTED